MHFACFRSCLLCIKLESVGQCLWEKKHHDRHLEMACCTVSIHAGSDNGFTEFTPEVIKISEYSHQKWQRFHSVWVSIGGQYRRFEDSWMIPMVVKKVRQLGSYSLIPASQSGL